MTYHFFLCDIHDFIKRLLKKGSSAYLTHVIDTQVNDIKLEDFHVVKEYLNAFSNELSNLLSDSYVEFIINLIPSITLIFIDPYKCIS